MKFMSMNMQDGKDMRVISVNLQSITYVEEKTDEKITTVHFIGGDTIQVDQGSRDIQSASG